MNLPTKLFDLTDALVRGAWTYQVVHGTDTGGAPFVTVEAARDGRHLTVTWHTRDTGTYRLHTVLIDRQRSSTYTVALGLAKEEM